MKCFKFSCSYEVFFFVFVYLKHIFHSIIVALLTVSVFCYHSVTTTCFTDFLVHSLCVINNKYILLPQYRFIVVDLIRVSENNKKGSDTTSDNLRGVILALTGNLIITYKSMSCFSTPCALPKLSD